MILRRLMVVRSRFNIILCLLTDSESFLFLFPCPPSGYVYILKLPTGSCELNDAASFTRVSDTWCGAHCFPFFSNSLLRVSVSDTVRARAHNQSTHAHVQTCSFGPWRREEERAFVCASATLAFLRLLPMRGFHLCCHCCCPKLRKTSSGPDGTM